MTIGIAWRLIVKELRLGPRSPVFLYAIFLPLLISFLIGGVFGSLFEAEPRLGVTDLGSSEVTAPLAELAGFDVSIVADADDLADRVEAHDLDAGLVLPAGFDAAVLAGRDTGAELFVAGESLASTRVAVVAAVEGVVDDRLDTGGSVEVSVVTVGDDDDVAIGDRLVPMMVMYAVVIAGLFLPAASLLEEREHRTLDALLVSPAQMGDVLVAKGVVAVVLATVMALVTLALNDAFGGQALLLTAIILVGSVMLAEIGLVLGLWAKDANVLFSAVKVGGIIIFIPVVFTIWPGLPQWIPRFAPTFYFLDPIFRVGVLGDGAGDVMVDVLIAVAVCVVGAPLVAWYAQRAERRIAVSA